MKRIAVLAGLAAVMLGCATSPHRAVEDTSPPHTVEDVTRRFSVPLEELYAASIAACLDVGATIFSMEKDSMVVAVSDTYRYGILLVANADFSGIMLFIESVSSSQGVIRKAVFDEFWAALEARL